MSDAEVKRWIIACAVFELAAWTLAWFFDWSTPAVVLAVVVSMGATGAIFEVNRRRAAAKKGER